MAASVLRNRLLSLLVTGAFVLGISTPQPHRQVLALSIERQPTTNNTRSKLEKSDRERMAQARADDCFSGTGQCFSGKPGHLARREGAFSRR